MMRLCESLLGKTVVAIDKRKIGKVFDILVGQRHVFPKIVTLVVKVRKGSLRSIPIKEIIRSAKFKEHNNLVHVPWSDVERIEKKKVVLKLNDRQWRKIVEASPRFPRVHKKISLVRDVLDEQIVDAGGHMIDRVDDVKIERIGGSFRIIGMDIGVVGVIERLGFERILNKLGVRITEKIIPWYLVKKVSRKEKKVFLKIPGEIL